MATTDDTPASIEDVEPVIKNQSVRFSVVQGDGGGEEFGAYQRKYSLPDNQADALAALWQAVDEGDVLAVTMAIKKCKDVAVDVDEPRKSDGVTPLAVAAQRGDCASIKMLLKNGANPDRTLVNGSSILYLAARHGKPDVVKLLVEGGAPVNQAKKSTGATPLMAACRVGHAKTVDMLLELGADATVPCPDGTTCVYVAAQGNFCSIIKVLHSKGADVNKSRVKGSTALFIASQKGRMDTVELLIELNANLDVKTDDGATPVVAAAQNGHVDVVRALVKRGADVKLPWKHGITALFLAAQEGHEDMTRLLVKELSHPIDVAEERHGFTPVFAAAQKGHVPVLQVLKEAGASLDKVSKPGLSPIMVASQQGQAKAVEWLANNNCDIYRTLPSGATTLFLAAQNGHAGTVESLIFANKKSKGEIVLMNQPREDGATPAFIAAVGGHYDVIDVLGQKGADLKSRNGDGVSPYQAAMDCPFRVQTVAAFRAHGIRRPGFLDACCGGGGGGVAVKRQPGRTSRLESDATVSGEVKDTSVRDSVG